MGWEKNGAVVSSRFCSFFLLLLPAHFGLASIFAPMSTRAVFSETVPCKDIAVGSHVVYFVDENGAVWSW